MRQNIDIYRQLQQIWNRTGKKISKLNEFIYLVVSCQSFTLTQRAVLLIMYVISVRRLKRHHIQTEHFFLSANQQQNDFEIRNRTLNEI